MGGISEVRQSPRARTKTRPPRLREASFKDYEQIASLESRYGLVPKSNDAWSHLWLGNPLYRELRAGWSIGWVLEDENNRIVGSMGNIPLPYELEGTRILVASGHAWVAEPAHRSASLILLDHVINQRGVDLYVNNTVNAATADAVSALECTRVPVGRWDESAFWVTDHQSFCEAYLAKKEFPFAKPLSYALSTALAFRHGLKTRALRDSEVEVKACSRFDERFDDFWLGLTQRHPHLLLAVRTREALDWHYKHALLNGTLWIATVMDGPRLAAYATFERQDTPNWGLNRVRLVDFQSLDGGTALLFPLLGWAIRKCQQEGIHVVEHVGRWLERGELLATFAPYRRKLPNWTYFYRANTSELAERLSSPGAWAPSLFDGDASL